MILKANEIQMILNYDTHERRVLTDYDRIVLHGCISYRLSTGGNKDIEPGLSRKLRTILLEMKKGDYKPKNWRYIMIQGELTETDEDEF